MDESGKVKMKDIYAKWDDPDYEEDPTVIRDWRSPVMARMREGDLNGMKSVSLPSVQFEVLKIAHEGKSEQTRLSACQFLLAQAGHGPMQKVQHDVNFEKMPQDQIMSIISSKIQNLEKLIPGFSLASLLTRFHPQQLEDEVVEIMPEE